MPLDRVPGQHFGALVDHENGLRGRSCLRGPPRQPAATDCASTTVSGGRSYDLLPFDASGEESQWEHIARLHSYRATPPR
jgi:hypothetical protein